MLLHTWDLAISIGVEVNWPEPDASVHLRMAQSAFPADQRGPIMPFEVVTHTDPDAPAMERLAAWGGRDTTRWSVRR